MDIKPRVYAQNHGKTQWACQYYRMEVPLLGFEQFGYAHTWLDKLEHGFQESARSMSDSDYDLFWSLHGQDFYEWVRTLLMMKPAKNQAGDWKYPPTTILDVDDNRDYLHPHNTAFCTQGVRSYPDGKLLKPGTKLSSPDPITGEPIVKWEDRVTWCDGSLFDIKRNLLDMELTHKIQRMVGGMTCASPHLAKYLHEVVGVKNVYFFPNTIIPHHYKSYPLIRTDKCIRILWQGGSSHIIDWWPLRHAMKEICEKYGDKIKFVVFGQLDDWMLESIPKERFEYHGWVDYAAYKLKRALLQIDINLCPLANNAFNRCKSAIKWYEASVWDEPEATLAANCPPFSDEMTDNVNGLLYKNGEEFVQKLSALIDDAELRRRLAAEAKQWVLTHRVPEKTIPPLWEFYQEVRNKQIGEHIMAR